MNIAALWQKLRSGGGLMVGVPDYQGYVRHMQQAHPELPPLSLDAFMQARMQARYGGKSSGKCPC